jgi:serine/threonine-protein kinase RsbW
VIQSSPTVRLELESRPESVTLVRSMLAGVAEPLAFDPELLDDLRTAVSEACNNVVLHAYDGKPGPLEVALEVEDSDVEVIVSDRGSGIQQIAAAATDRMGVGLAVISALADRAEFLSSPDGGTEVRMSFTARGVGAPPAAHPTVGEPEPWPQDLDGDVVVKLTPVALLAAVLGRVTRALAAAARFSLDRFSDVYLVTDAIAAHAQTAISRSWIGFAIAVSNRRLEIVIGPFRGGTGELLVVDERSKRPDSPLATLADELTVEPAGESEMMRIVLVDQRRPAVGQ